MREMSFLPNLTYGLIQWCPTLLLFATCVNSSFKCCDRKLFRNSFVMRNKPHFCQILQFIIQSGYSKVLFVTYVAMKECSLPAFSIFWQKYSNDHIPEPIITISNFRKFVLVCLRKYRE
jgi:hypothetical protein